MTDLSYIPFHGGHIVATLSDGKPVVALRPICEHIGLAYGSQRNRLKRQPWATVFMMNTVGADGKDREMTAIDRQTFTMWLATIETSRIKNPATKDLVITYQREAAKALDSYFHDGGAINPRANEHQVNALIRQSQMRVELLQAARGLIHPDHLEAKARVVIARGLGEAPEIDPLRAPLYTQDFLKEKGLSKKQMASKSGVFGKRVKAAYIEKHGVEPGRYHLNISNGQTKQVYAYTEADRALMQEVWDRHFETAPKLEIVS